MGMVKVIANEVVDMVAVGHSLVPAAGTVGVAGIVPIAGMGGGTPLRIGLVYFNHVLVDMILVGVMEMTVVKIIYVVTVTDGRVATIDAMLMVMIPRMLIFATAHGPLLHSH